VVLYRWDVQKRYATDLVATGDYYWINVHYVEANDPTEFDLARDQVLTNNMQSHRAIVDLDRWKCTRLSDGVVVQNSALSANPIFPGSGEGILTNTILQWLIYEDGSRGFKRWRLPLFATDIDDGGLLTSTFVSLWHANAPDNADTDWNWHRNLQGSPVVDTFLSPFAHGWQLRHGTRRSERRALHA